MSKYLIEFRALQADPIVGVPRLEQTGGDWKQTRPALFPTADEAQRYLDALSAHYASALGSDLEVVRRYFSVVPIEQSTARNLHLVGGDEATDARDGSPSAS